MSEVQSSLLFPSIGAHAPSFQDQPAYMSAAKYVRLISKFTETWIMIAHNCQSLGQRVCLPFSGPNDVEY